MLTIPQKTLYTVTVGVEGLPVFAVQRVCNKLGYSVVEDMDFGPKTKAAAERMQQRVGVTPDGVVGPATQAALAKYLSDRQEISNGLPDQLLWSQISYESGGYLGAVNWNTPGGVDCGITQRRVYDEQYSDDAAVKRAFDAVYQIDLLGDRVQELFGIFLARPGCKGNRELAYRVAVLNHNYPSLADQISRVGISGLSSYYTSPQSWVKVNNVHFPDGTAITTPLQWGQRYALGNSSHAEPGQATRLVKSWG